MADKLVSMKLDPKKREEQYAECAVKPDRPLYPWGLELRLDDDALEKLGLAKLPPAGGSIMVLARAEVTGSNSRDEVDSAGKVKTSQSLTLQITDLCLEDEKPKVATESKLYAAKG